MKSKDRLIKWNPEIAYAVGLLTTDGNLSIDGRHIDFTSKDKELINTSRKCLNLKNKVGYKSRGHEEIKQYCRVQFGNVILYKWLLNIGLMPNKTKRIEALKVPNRYFFSFLRGHLDGDGSICKYQDLIYPNSQRLYIIFLSANLKHIQWIQKKIKSLLKIKGSIAAYQGLFSLKFAKKDSLTLLPHLYPANNVPCLKRKYKIARSFLE